jgi:predicted phage replisome organizer
MIDMKERKYVKLRTDMYADTKFKIIDTKPERDMIHYVWTRFVTLAGKVNMEGELYMSRNLPYTIETLAIEFNRSEEQIKLALEVFIELEMIELVDGRIYRVKNFAKHQNIKVKEKVNSKDEVIVVTKNKEESVKETVSSEQCIDEVEKKDSDDTKSENKEMKEKAEYLTKDYDNHKESICSGINEENNINSEVVEPKLKENIPIPIQSRKDKKLRGKKKQEDAINVTEEEDNNGDELLFITDGERPIGEGERILFKMSF